MVESQRQQVQVRNPDMSSHNIQSLLGSQRGDEIIPMSSGSATGSVNSGTYPENFQRDTSYQMSEQLQLIPLELPLNDGAPPLISNATFTPDAF